MKCKNPRPLNGNGADKGTKCRAKHGPSRPVGSQKTDKTPRVNKAEIRVEKAIHGLVFNLLPDPTNPLQWTNSVVAQVLLKDNIFEDVLKKYLEQLASASIEVSTSSGDAAVSHAFKKKSPDKVLANAGTSVLKNRLMKTTQVKKLKSELEGLAKIYGAEIKSVFVNKEWTKMFVVVATGAVAGGIVVGLVDTARRTKSDTLGSVATGLASLIPETLYEVGDLKLNLKLGHTGIDWTPSKGTWKSSAFVSGQWQAVSAVKLKGRVEVLGSEKGVKGKAQIGATYVIGETYLDSIDGKGTVFTDGNYELLLQLNKRFSGDADTQFDAFIGAKYKGNFSGEPNPDRGNGASVIGGFRLRFKGL